MRDHAKHVLSGIVPNRRDNLLRALQHLEPAHFRNTEQRNLFTMLERYYDVAADILPRETLADLLGRSGADATKTLLYEQLYDECSALAVPDHEFRFSIDALKDLRAEQLTGEAFATSFEILERGAEVGEGRDRRELRGHASAREYAYSQLAEIDRLGNAASSPEGDVRQEAKEIRQDYVERKQGKAIGTVRTGISQIDAATSGLLNGELILICAYTGEGKALRAGTGVLTPGGWRPIEDLAAGDTVVGSDGRPTKVRATASWQDRPTWRLTTADRAEVVADSEHLWTVQDQNDRAGRTAVPWQTLTTVQLAEGLAQGRRFYLPLVKPVEFDGDLPGMDPYLVGALLGDGSLSHPTSVYLLQDSGDVAVVERCSAALSSGETFVKTSGACQYYLRGRHQVTRALLDEMGLRGPTQECHSKHVPEWVKVAPPEYRLEVLRGLMDTDGHCSEKGTAEFTSASRQLAEDVRDLVESLGGTAIVGTRASMGAWRCRPRLDVNPFWLERKAARWASRAASLRSAPSRPIRSVEPEGRADTVCVEVEAEDGLFVTEHHIVTHNSMLTTQIAWDAAVTQGKNVFFSTSETIRPQVRRRLLARHSRLPQFGLPRGLNSADLKNGTLSPEEEEVFEQVVDDFTTNPTYGKIHLAQVPRGATLGFLEARLNRQQQNWNIDLVVIDYLALLKPDRHRQTSREEFNDVLKDAKVMATAHDGGRGVPIISPWAMSQTAYKEALRTGEYQLANLAETSEAEKSPDQIWAMLRLPDAPNEVKMQSLKNRDGDTPSSFVLATDYRAAFLGQKDSSGMASLLDTGEDSSFGGSPADDLGALLGG